MPGRQLWGEISSCSDCTDYQARRLDIKDNQDRLDVGIKAGYNLDLQTLVLNICVLYSIKIVPRRDKRGFIRDRFISGQNFGFKNWVATMLSEQNTTSAWWKKTFLFFQFLPYSERYSLRRAADDHRALRAAANLKGQRGRAAGSSPLSPTAGSSARLTQERKTQSDLC